MRQTIRNSQNEPGMSFGINETEKWGGERRRLKPEFRSFMPSLSHSLPTRYVAKSRLHRGWSASIILQLLDLASQLRRIRGQFSVETKTAHSEESVSPLPNELEGISLCRIFSR